MDSPIFRFPSSPGMPLFPVSPERLNAATYYEIPDSPTRSPRHKREHSDVHGMVARFNSLDIKDHAEMRKKDEAALRRAQMGREEAEEEMRKMKEESGRLEKELEETREREKKVVKRLDVVMEDLHRTKEGQVQSQALYEKEIRRTKKEAFKSSSALVKLQEELKATRNALRTVSSDRDLEKIKVGKRDQEVFKAQYQLVGAQEELAQLQAKVKDALARVKVVEEERDALKQSLKEEEVARIAAEGRIALPPSKQEDDGLVSPRKASQKSQPPVLKDLDVDFLQSLPVMEELQELLDLEKRRAATAEAQADFMKMECQFGCCACQIADQEGLIYVYDDSLNDQFQVLLPIRPKPESSQTRSSLVIVESSKSNDDLDAYLDQQGVPNSPISYAISEVQQEAMAQSTDTWPIMEPPQTPRIASVRVITPEPEMTDGQHDASEGMMRSTRTPSPHATENDNTVRIVGDLEAPRTPEQNEKWAFTTVTRVPLKDGDGPTQDFSAFRSPANLTREEAMEQIRQRRGRARSVAGTPKRLLSVDQTPRRDISAPEMGQVKTPGTAARSQSRPLRS